MATFPVDMSFPEDFRISIEENMPDSHEPVVTRKNFLIARGNLTANIGYTLGKIEKVKHDLEKCDDLRMQQRFQRELKELHCKLLWHIERLESF